MAMFRFSLKFFLSSRKKTPCTKAKYKVIVWKLSRTCTHVNKYVCTYVSNENVSHFSDKIYSSSGLGRHFKGYFKQVVVHFSYEKKGLNSPLLYLNFLSFLKKKQTKPGAGKVFCCVRVVLQDDGWIRSRFHFLFLFYQQKIVSWFRSKISDAMRGGGG